MSSKQLAESALRIVLLGKTGVGKSESGNAILGRKAFLAKLSSVSVTNECKTETREFEGQTLAVVDTPGLFHTTKTQTELMKAILDFACEVQPGPHVLLLVLKLGATDENDKVVQIFQKVFKDAAAHTIVLFTHGDECEVDDKLNKKLKNSTSQFSDFHVFDNMNQNEDQVNSLFQKIKKVVQDNKGKYYSNEMLKKADEAFNEAMQCPEMKKSEINPKENVKSQLMSLTSKGLEKLEEHTPPWVRTFLEFLQKAALEYMPAGSY